MEFFFFLNEYFKSVYKQLGKLMEKLTKIPTLGDVSI